MKAARLPLPNLMVVLVTSLGTVMASSGVAVLKGVCTDGFFQCGNDTTCMPQDHQCDGIPHCPGGSDELDCEDKKDNAFWDHMFKKRTGAELDDNNEPCSLNYFDQTCLCKMATLLCDNRNLTSAPNYLPKGSIDLLDLTLNNFAVLSWETLKNIPDNVSKLTLDHCNITSISAQAFFGLGNLQDLHLSNNGFSRFPEGLFREGSSLVNLTVTYSNISWIHPDAFVNLKQLSNLDLRGNKLTTVESRILEPLENLTYLDLQKNEIRIISGENFPKMRLSVLSLTHNRISRIEKGAFRNVKLLISLYLSNNALEVLENGTFLDLGNLESLTLNDNLIRKMEAGLFKDVPNLKHLNLERNKFRRVEKELLDPLVKLINIYFDSFEMCPSANRARVCSPRGDGISSYEHLLDNPLLRASVWIMGSVGCTGNLIVLFGRFLGPSNNVVHALYLRNLALSDLLMGIYLFIIAAADLTYRDVYLMFQYKWRHSIVCNLSGFLSTLSCGSSVLILTLVTWDRFISVTQPLARKQPSAKTATLTLLVLWLIAILIAVAPLSSFTQSYFGDEFYGNNGVCLSLHIHEPYAKGWEYSAAMFILVNILAILFISYAYLRMINEIKASGVACRSTRQSQERDKVARRFGIIVLTDCMCWVPVIVVKLIALSGHKVPQTLYAWLAIFVLPIHSALNPVLYTLTTTVFKKQVRKVLNTCLYKRRRPEHQHSASESGFSLSLGVFPIGGSRRILSYRGTQSSFTLSNNSWKRPAAV